MDPVVIALFILGLVFLVAGAEVLVRGASDLALAVGISPMVVGLTVVAFGTSAPEMAVSVKAAYSGQAGADIAMGNVIGSNICNILLILGISAAVAPLIVAQQFVRKEVPIMIGVSLIVWLFAWDGSISRLEGILLFGGVIAYVAMAVRASRKETATVQAEYQREYGEGEGEVKRKLPLWLALLYIVGGLALLVLGSRWLVEGAMVMARILGISELIIGLTIVAVGTSLPEVATSVIASMRGEREIAVGNAVGSCIFNLLSVLGLAAIVAPNGINVAPNALQLDIPIMVATSALCLPIFFTGMRINRWEGLLFLGLYVAYTAYLILVSSSSEALDTYSMVMRWVVLPVSTLVLLATAVMEFHKLRKAADGAAG